MMVVMKAGWSDDRDEGNEGAVGEGQTKVVWAAAKGRMGDKEVELCKWEVKWLFSELGLWLKNNNKVKTT